MKKLLTILILLFALNAHPQDTQCDSGYRIFPCVSTSSLEICITDCIPDSVYNELMLVFRENMCGEMGSGFVGMSGEGSFSYYNGLHWNDSTKECERHAEWLQMRCGKWVNITEEEYNKLNIRNAIKIE